MGGTSFEACLIKGGEPQITTEGEVGGEWLATPKLDIHSIGAGGGSIAWINPGGLLEVGPKSAGADPGPVCYDRGGEVPTVTDADLILGYLDPDYFFGGRLRLSLEKAKRALDEKVAKPLKLSVVEAAEGIFRIINHRMSNAVAVVSTRKGFDPREFTLIVAGGAGPIHAAPIAEEMGIPRVIVPRDSSVFCASGMLMCDLKHDFIRTYTHSVDDLDLTTVNQFYSRMIKEGTETLRNEGIAKEKIVLSCSMDIRYIGQFSEVEVSFEMDEKGNIGSEKLRKIVETFHQRHDTLYGYSMPSAGVEIINLRVCARGITDKPKLKELPYKGKDASLALKGKRQAFFEGKFMVTPIYGVERLEHGNVMQGPALLEQSTSTTVVPPGWNVVCDAFGNFELKRN
jgi:N-methylhydantoinase A